MDINKKTLGLITLRYPPNCDVDVVAVHGMAADPERTWNTKLDEGQSIDWLQDESMLPSVLPNARIMRYGYQSGFGRGGGGRVRASEVAQALLKLLHEEREEKNCIDRPLIFVAHSFGGLAVLELLVAAKLEASTFPRIYQSTIGIVTFSTPFRGTDPKFSGTAGVREPSWLLEKVEELHDIVYQENYDIFRRGDYSILDMVQRFRRSTKDHIRPQMLCIYEKDQTDLGRMVKKKGEAQDEEQWVMLVDEHSGTMDEDSTTTIHGRSCGHVDVQRFGSADDPDFKILKGFLRKTLAQGTDMINRRRQSLRASMEGPDADEIKRERDEILSWLSSSANSGGEDLQVQRRDRLLEKHHPDTGKWLFQRQEYIDWVNPVAIGDENERDDKPLLWLHGRPGAGKSVLVAQVAQILSPVIVIYCEYRNRECQTRQSLLCGAIRQVIQQIDTSCGIPEEMHNVWMKYKHEHNRGSQGVTLPGPLPVAEGFRLLMALVQRLPKCYIILDGLDEYRGETRTTRPRFPIDLFEDLYAVTEKCPSHYRMLVASRDDVYHAHKDWIKASSIDVVAAHDDIAKYVSSRLDYPRFGHLKALSEPRNAWLREKIIKTLCERANGVFIIPFLHLQIIETKTDLRRVDESLADLPEELSDLYELALNRICEHTGDGDESGLRILEIVLCAATRLRLPELQHALATRERDLEFEELGCFDMGTIIAQTGGLVSIDHNELVLFMHHTVDEYLATDKVFQKHFSRGYVRMQKICHTYINFKGLKNTSNNIFALHRRYAFLRYACFRYGHHMSRCIERDEMKVEKAFDFLEDRDNMPLASLQVVASQILTIPSADRMYQLVRLSSTLHLAILWNIEPVIGILGNKRTGLEWSGFKDQKPLHYAARCLSMSATTILLRNSVEVNSTEVEGRTPLDLILARPWRDAALHLRNVQLQEFLIGEIHKYMKEAESKQTKDMTPEEYAIAQLRNRRVPAKPITKREDFIEELRRLRRTEKDSELMASLIIRGLDFDITDDGETIAIMLIKEGADVNSLEVEDTTPLQLAAYYGREKLVKTLLEHDANPFLKSLMGLSAFQIAGERAKKFGESKPAFLRIAELIAAKMASTEEQENKVLDEDEKKRLPGVAQAQVLTGTKREAYEKMLARMGRQPTYQQLAQFTMPGAWNDAW